MAADRTDTPEKLIETATRLFADQGTRATTIRQIAKEAGVNSALISYHFGDKAGLEQAVVDGLYERLAELQTLLVPTALVDLDAFAMALWREVYARRDAVRVIQRQLVSDGHLEFAGRWDWLQGRVGTAAAQLAEATGRDPALLRQNAITVAYVFTRYALNNEAELCRVVGAHTVDEAHALVARHLASVMRALAPG